MIDGIAYINLTYRQDRKKHIVAELEKLSGITTNVHRIDAVLEPLCGHLGCGQSHIKAIELAIEKNWDTVLIVEDDLFFTHPAKILQTRISDAFRVNWDVLLLGFGYVKSSVDEHPFLTRVKSATCTHGYIVRKHFYQTLMTTFQAAVDKMRVELEKHIETCAGNITKLNYCSAIDQAWYPLQKEYTFYCFNPILGAQHEPLYSDNNCSINQQKKKIQNSK
jgi:GR25 family glycosyltransferase involved in LPS biosynthesis